MKTFITKSLITVMKAIIAQQDINEQVVITQIDSYIALTPWYVKIVVILSMIYCNALSLITKHSTIYSLSNDQVENLLNKFHKSFIGHSIIMIMKLVATLVYFDDDTHAEHIGYKHLAHCK